jgi:LacI family transcriptional regulator
MTTIRDIARESGFSVSTVSRVLSGHPDVSPETAAAVKAVVEKRDFSVNSNARNLKRTHSPVILIMVKGRSNNFFASLLENVQEEVLKSGNSTVVQYIDEDDNEVAVAEKLVAEVKPKGLVFLGGNASYFESHAKRIGEIYPAVVLTNSLHTLGRPGLSSVSTDNEEAARLAVEHLISKGHRSIGIIGGDLETSTSSRLRLDGARAAFAAHKLVFDLERFYVSTRYSVECGYDAVQHLVKGTERLSAIYAMSDIMAIGAVRALADMGLSVPSDVSVIGHDGILLTEYVVPRISTVRQPAALFAKMGVRTLLHHIGGDLTAEYHVVPVELVPGESVRPLR